MQELAGGHSELEIKDFSKKNTPITCAGLSKEPAEA
jgi:hypothetical protein